jgi:hypothetical protein
MVIIFLNRQSKQRKIDELVSQAKAGGAFVLHTDPEDE